MSFNILDNLDKLDIIKMNPTWILAICPVCSGKLTINRSSKHGAYACWSNACHKKSGNLIRTKLYNRYNPFNRTSLFEVNRTVRPLVKVIKPRSLDSNLESKDFLTNVVFTRPLIIKDGNKLTTYFDYVDFKIVRLDYVDVEGNKIKYIYPISTSKEGIEVQELPNAFTSLPVYKVDYIQPSMVFVEGEKCAMVGQYLGIACATFPSFVHTVQYLDRCVYQLYSMGVSNVLYLRDNDQVGLEKAKFVANTLSKNNIGNKIVNVADLYGKSDVDKYDLYDLYKDRIIRPSTVPDVINQCLNE